jgi:hypothetical protein
MESWNCSMLKMCLGTSPWHLGGPFLRDLGLVGAPFVRPWLPSVGGCTRLSCAHQTLHNATIMYLLIGYFLLLGAPDCLVVGTRLSGAHANLWLQVTCQVAVGLGCLLFASLLLKVSFSLSSITILLP